MHTLIIFASGKGSNAKAIIDYFKTRGDVKVSLIVTNKADAGVIDIARDEGIEHWVIDRNVFANIDFAEKLSAYKPSLIILAGFLWKVPDAIIHAFAGRIINIHPALLPNYGGKGMYGDNVHNAVIQSSETVSGISIHHVNEVYDSGGLILQATCEVKQDDTTDTLAYRIHKLEHFYYPRAIEFLLKDIPVAK